MGAKLTLTATGDNTRYHITLEEYGKTRYYAEWSDDIEAKDRFLILALSRLDWTKIDHIYSRAKEWKQIDIDFAYDNWDLSKEMLTEEAKDV